MPGRLTTWHPAPIGAPVVAVAAPQPKDDPFYPNIGAKPLATEWAAELVASGGVLVHLAQRGAGPGRCLD